ncbi:MAG: VWA domain-containing protein [Phycisphaerales bacterium]|jgi:hypothetical protein|nr:VWA domain-containing protein [Phycisphaerales bacterium]MBT7170654.1 VWA domain-containing protein [Phycisphaerales bacterium]
MSLSWDNSWLLWLAPLAWAIVWWVNGSRWRARSQSAVTVVCQMLAAGMLTAALAGPRVAREGAALEWLVCEDASASMVAADALAMEDRPFRRLWFDQMLHVSRPMSTSSRTAMSDVLDYAASELPNLAGVVIRTDGRWHDDISPATARLKRALAASGKTVFFIPQRTPRRDAAVTAFAASRLAGGELELAATVEANHICQRRLVLTSPAGTVLLDKTLKLLPRQPARFTRRVPAAAGTRFGAELTPSDALANNRREAVLAPLRSRLAILADPAPAWATLLAKQLTEWEIVTSPSRAEVLSASVVLARPKSLPLLKDATGGVVLLDAADSPLSVLVPDAQSRTPLAVTVLLDASASMGAPLPGGHTPFGLATAAVRNLSGHLTKDDSVRVIAFDTTARDVFVGRGDQLSTFRPTMTPTGQTDIAPALKLALDAPGESGKTRLVLVFSDLDTAKFDVAAMAKRCRDAKLKLAVAALGEAGADSSLAGLCNHLGATLSILKSPRTLNALFASVIAAERPGIQPSAESPKASASVESLSALPRSMMIRLCRAKKNAVVLATASDEPLCAVGNFGRRRIATLALVTPAPESLAPAAEALAELVTLCAPAQGDPRLALSTRRDGRRIALTILATDKAVVMTELTLRARTGTLAADFAQTAPGRYEAKFVLPASLAGEWVHVTVENSAGRVVASAGVVAGCVPEAQTLSTAPQRVEALAAELGAIVTTAAQLPAQLQRATAATGSLAATLYLLALVAMLASWLMPIFTKSK